MSDLTARLVESNRPCIALKAVFNCAKQVSGRIFQGKRNLRSHTRYGIRQVDGGILGRILVTAFCHRLNLQMDANLTTIGHSGLVIRDSSFGPPGRRSADHGVS